ncbi:MAG TPA: DUF1801 domain-containing protein [Candidatus Krumholzibacteria bacterium]|nr:DUF1801 domain-containing protein [Candidatus Krumholzibacteria bacterium]
MSTREQIKTYLDTQPEPKRGDMQQLHRLILGQMPECKLWFVDGKNDAGRTVCNPNVGYGLQVLRYADGRTREFYQIGMSANTTGISIYVLGLSDKKYLARVYGKKLGKASVTGYCIKFKALADIDIDTLAAAIRDGIEQTAIQQD